MGAKERSNLEVWDGMACTTAAYWAPLPEDVNDGDKVIYRDTDVGAKIGKRFCIIPKRYH